MFESLAQGAVVPGGQQWVATNALVHRWTFKQPSESLALGLGESLSPWTARSGAKFVLDGGSPPEAPHLLVTALAGPSNLVMEARLPAIAANRFNRLTFKVRVDAPAQSQTSLSLVWQGGVGSMDIPPPTWFTVGSGNWTHLHWEFPPLTLGEGAFLRLEAPTSMNPALKGTEMALRLGGFVLERVPPDHSRGWAVVDGRMAFSHVGYAPQRPKSAVASSIQGDGFRIIEVVARDEAALAPRFANDTPQSTQRERSELRLPISQVESPLGRFQVLDFLALTDLGEFSIRTDRAQSRPFPIQPHPWIALVGPLEAFYKARRARDGEVAGGWHEDPWFSRSPIPTAESVMAHSILATQLHGSLPSTAASLREEAIWGMRWLLGARDPENDHPLHTAPLIPHGEGMWESRRSDATQDCFAAATAGATMARLLKDNPGLPSGLLERAKKDFQAALAATPPGAARSAAGWGMRAALALFHATGEQAYLNHASEFAAVLVDAPDSPVRVQTPTALSEEGDRACEGLVGLIEAMPRHAKSPEWHAAVVEYSEALLAAARQTTPFGVAIGGSGSTPRAANPILLSRARAAAAAARIRHSPELSGLAERHLQWMVGRNPFNMSFVAGVGYDHPPQFSPVLGNVFGAVMEGPTLDPAGSVWLQAATNPKQHGARLSSGAALALLVAELSADTPVKVVVEPGSRTPVLLTEVASGLRFEIQPAPATGTILTRLPHGTYKADFGPREQGIHLFGPRQRELNLAHFIHFDPKAEILSDGRARVRLRMNGEGDHQVRIRPHNFEPTQREFPVSFTSGFQQQVTIEGVIPDPRKTAFLIVIPNRDLEQRMEIILPKRP